MVDASWGLGKPLNPTDLIRKARHVLTDPVLRRWLAGRVTGRWPGAPGFTPHVPPYLDGAPPLAAETPDDGGRLGLLAADPPASLIDLPLAGERVPVAPGEERDLFGRRFADAETLLALHRFAWLPVMGEGADPAWVGALWTAWRRAHGAPDKSWAWNPYTAAERAVNILAFARRRGLPGPKADTLAVLAAHGPAIAAGLEYFGDHHTSNHLATNGRGLYLLGLELALPRCAQMGARILIEEAARIFLPSGVLREGSSHYHLLLTRNYADAWLAARRHRRPEADRLAEITARALAIIPGLRLPGGLPLIGDISPDCPPEFLSCLAPGATTGDGWTASLDDDERDAFVALRDTIPTADAAALAADGWLGARFGPWAGLWHAAAKGWAPMPGHGHQDTGGFEIHFGAEPVFVDVGRGAYGETGAAAHDRSGQAHNTLLVDGLDPYPPNRPYYDDGFRAHLTGPPPHLRRDGDGVTLRHGGYSRLADVGAVERRWTFSDGAMSILDRVEGTGRHRIECLLHTPHPVLRSAGGLVVQGAEAAYRITADGHQSTGRATRWRAYGAGDPATVIRIRNQARLPFQAVMKIEAL